MANLKVGCYLVGMLALPITDVNMANLKVGCYIKIKNMKSEPEYSGKVGKVILIDNANQIHGTWGWMCFDT